MDTVSFRPDTDDAVVHAALDGWADSADLVDSYLRRCPARDILAVLADKWVLLVLGVLRVEGGPVRFNELRRRLDGITQKMLTQTLRTLERDGLIRRSVYPTVPPRVEYTLTALGADLGRLTHALGAWSLRHMDEIHSARAEFDERRAAAPQPL
ncbi:helix-turn-helix domain-containing protein [Nocardia sp. BMG111209]|uniref:winged helix-turn-helix transcriptional regulator n=1 Tax=Nocardia sp. BMG111209 TaxID=1160137 RepID=UPI00037C7203|nr:helix-turn-helix domain-containing protein [Nocardia sp. BMG111209]